MDFEKFLDSEDTKLKIRHDFQLSIFDKICNL